MSKRLLPKAYAALLLSLAALPLFVLPAAALVPAKLWLAALLPVPALLLTGGAGLLQARRRALALALAVLIMAAGCAAAFMPNVLAAVLLFLACLPVMLSFLPAMARPAHQEWGTSRLGCGILLHVAAQIAKTFAPFTAAAAPLTWIFAAYLVAALFSFNRGVLTGNSPAAFKPLLTKNRKLLAGLCLLALLLANLKPMIAAVRAALLWCAAAVLQVAAWIASLFYVEGTDVAATQGTDNSLDFLAESSEPGLFAQIMEIVLFVVAGLAAAILLFFALRHLIRLLKKALRAILNRLQAYRQRIAADYVDQSETLLDWGELRKTAQDRFTRFKRRHMPVPWDRLTPAQRVRRVYALLLRRPDNQNPALTARETLLDGALQLPPDAAADLAALYDRARYSDHPVAAQEADGIRKRIGV
jgi:hypothetical protein